MPTLAHRLAALLARRESRPARIERGIDHLHDHALRLEARMTSTENEYGEQLGTLIGVVVAEVESLRNGIAVKDAALVAAQQYVADADERTAQQVADALAADSAADADRTKGWLDQLAAAAPVTVPEVAIPEPGEAAEPPADSGLEVPEAPAAEPGAETV